MKMARTAVELLKASRLLLRTGVRQDYDPQQAVLDARDIDLETVRRAAAESGDEEGLLGIANYIYCVAGMNLDTTPQTIHQTCFPYLEDD